MIGIAPDNTRVYAFSYNVGGVWSSPVFVIDIAFRQIISTMPGIYGMSDIDMDPNRNRAYVASNEGIGVYDISTDTFMTVWDVGDVNLLTYDEENDVLLTTDRTSWKFISPNTGEVVQTLTSPGISYLRNSVVSHDGTRIYTPDIVNNSLYVLEITNQSPDCANAVYYLKLISPNVGEQTKQYLGIIAQETRLAEKIITALFDFAYPKAVNREPVSVAELVQLVLERYPAPESVSVSFDGLDNLPQVLVDAGQIEQVLGNQVANACEALVSTSSTTRVSQGGQLTISAKAEKETIALAVQDTGIGISPENMTKLFEPLFSTKTVGIGLGLAVSQKLVEANNGRIEVESEPGAGTTFTIYLLILPMKTEA